MINIMIHIMINIMILLMTFIMTNIMTNIMINVMTAWKKVHSHSGQLSIKTGTSLLVLSTIRHGLAISRFPISGLLAALIFANDIMQQQGRSLKT